MYTWVIKKEYFKKFCQQQKYTKVNKLIKWSWNHVMFEDCKPFMQTKMNREKILRIKYVKSMKLAGIWINCWKRSKFKTFSKFFHPGPWFLILSDDSHVVSFYNCTQHFFSFPSFENVFQEKCSINDSYRWHW